MTLVAVCAISCSNSKTRRALLPNISGKPGEVIVVIDRSQWEGALGNTLRDTLECDCPFLPQKEPLYNLVNVAPAGFTNMFQIHRNIIIAHISPEVTSPGVVFKTDMWAAPQCVIRINASTSEQAIELFNENSEKIKAVLDQAERSRVITNAMKYEEVGIAPVVTQMA